MNTITREFFLLVLVKCLIPARFTELIEKALYLHINSFTRYYLEISFQGIELWYFVGLISSRHLGFTYHNVVLTVFNYLLLSLIFRWQTASSQDKLHICPYQDLWAFGCPWCITAILTAEEGEALSTLDCWTTLRMFGDRLDITIRNWLSSKK